MYQISNKLFYILLLLLLICFFIGFIFFYLSYKNNLDFKRDASCRDLGFSYYSSKTGECEKKILKEEDLETPKYLCDFSVDYINKERRNVDGIDLELIKDLKEKCQNGKDLLSKFACFNLEQEKDKEYHKTYFDLEGVLKTNGDEYLQFIGVELYTMDTKQILLGQSVIEFNKDVRRGEKLSFSITVLIDRSDEEIARFFQKEDEVLISTSPVYSTCR